MKPNPLFIKILTIITVVYSFDFGYIRGQEVLDVLPEEGRDELFHTWLMEELQVLSDQRKSDVADSLQSVGLLQSRQARLKEDYLMLLGELPQKTALNPVIVGTINGEGYKIERLYFESLPNHHVTANFYYPTDEEGPFPAILVTCGHYAEAKAAGLYQKLCILLAKHGFAALIVDPICQGERNQVLNPLSGTLYYSGESGTKAHTRLDVGAVLVGTSVVAYELWDNHRSIDYLLTRTGEVDPNKIGLTGSSGGGAQATFLAAFDDRIKVAAVNSFIMNEPALFSTIGPQTGSQNLSYEGIYGIDHPEYISMFAPKPFQILAGTQDFFDIEGTHETLAEEQVVYDTLGVSDQLGFFEYDDEHGYSRPKREEAVRWFRTWFHNDTTSIVEEEDQATLFEHELRASEYGQVFNSFENEITVQDINLEYAEAFAPAREEFWSSQTPDSCLDKVKQLIRLNQEYETPLAEVVETINRDGYSIEKIKLTSGNQVPVTGLLFIPDNLTERAPAVLYVDGRGKSSDAEEGGIIEALYTDSGKVVFAIDVRGFGETTDDPSMNESKHGNNEHRNAVISLYLGKTLIGQRVEDIMKATDYLFTRTEIDTNTLSIVGINRAGSAVLHAAALDDRMSEAVIRDWTDTSWVTVVADPTALNNMTHEVPSALKFYDLPDLIQSMAPRQVFYRGEPVIEDALNENRKSSGTDLIEIFPNPAHHSAAISYSIPEDGKVFFGLYDIQGNEIDVLVDQFQGSDHYKLDVDTSCLPAGIYLSRLMLDGQLLSVRKLVIL
ncbi:MAG: acetylxylan esterase [Bacteroidales bacterium]|nr:acetylxylan esterase [Bacteroidales bacterium]